MDGRGKNDLELTPFFPYCPIIHECQVKEKPKQRKKPLLYFAHITQEIQTPAPVIARIACRSIFLTLLARAFTKMFLQVFLFYNLYAILNLCLVGFTFLGFC